MIILLKSRLNKVVVSHSDSKYEDFDPDTAVQTYDIIGKHISEFKRDEGENVPEIIQLVFSYFEQNEEYMKVQGIFRLSADTDLLQEIEEQLKAGNYEFLQSVTDPVTVAVYIK